MPPSSSVDNHHSNGVDRSSNLRIAVIGSGIAGLSVSYLLSRRPDCEVHLFEKSSVLGMDAHSIDVDLERYTKILNESSSVFSATPSSSSSLSSPPPPTPDTTLHTSPSGGKMIRIDMPLRVFTETYYPNLTGLYDSVGVDYAPEDYSGSFSSLDGENFFGYKNLLLGRFSIPYWPANLRLLTNGKFWRILRDLMYFLLMAPRHLKQGKLGNINILKQYTQNAAIIKGEEGKGVEAGGRPLTFGTYLKEENYSSDFIDSMLIPTLAGICTCTRQAILDYPALLIIDYLSRRSMRGVRRVKGGTNEVVHSLTKNVHVHLGSSITEIRPIKEGGGVFVKEEGKDGMIFSHVILATQANQALALVGPFIKKELKEALNTIKYERSKLILHVDDLLMPKDIDMWKPVNFILPHPPISSSSSSSCIENEGMATIWMNAVQRNIGCTPNVFQSWNPNPLCLPRPHTILGQGEFERPVVTYSSLAALRVLWESQGENGIWFCGSYAHVGVPLLETAVSSAVDIAAKLGVDCPWGMKISAEEEKKKKSNSVSKEGVWFSGVVTMMLLMIFCLATIVSSLRR